MRPPIIVCSPVSTNVTRHGSAAALCTSTLLCFIVECDVRHVQKVILEVLLDDVTFVS